MTEQTELDGRIAALRLLLGMIIAHLDDARIIDMGIVEADMRKLMNVSHTTPKAYEDIARIFGIAEELAESWSSRLSEQ